MDDCDQYSIEIITVPLKERIAGTNFFLDKNILLKINTVPFKEWIITILSVTKTDALLKDMNGCH